MENIVEIEHLTKSFGEVKAVQDKATGAGADLGGGYHR